VSRTSYHVGQVVDLSRLLTKEGRQWITIVPGQSRRARDKGGAYLKQL